jgi:hypothetical protein
VEWSGKYTGVAQWYERFAFNKVVEGSIPSTGITEGDTAQGAKHKTNVDFKRHCLYGKAICPFSSVGLEHQSYELRVGSSSLPMDIWSGLWSIFPM